jgi:hypothetical protein
MSRRVGLGGAIGGVLTYKRLSLMVPLSVQRVADAGANNYLTTSRSAVVVTPSVLAGVTF